MSKYMVLDYFYSNNLDFKGICKDNMIDHIIDDYGPNIDQLIVNIEFYAIQNKPQLAAYKNVFEEDTVAWNAHHIEITKYLIVNYTDLLNEMIADGSIKLR